MKNWYEVKVKYGKITQDGMDKIVTEVYLIDSLSFTEAEARATEELEPFVTGVFDIAAVAKKNFSEVHLNGLDGTYFLSTINLVTVSEKDGNEKLTKIRMIVEASSFQDALDITEVKMSSSMLGYHIAGIVETPIMDVFLYHLDESQTLA